MLLLKSQCRGSACQTLVSPTNQNPTMRTSCHPSVVRSEETHLPLVTLCDATRDSIYATIRSHFRTFCEKLCGSSTTPFFTAKTCALTLTASGQLDILFGFWYHILRHYNTTNWKSTHENDMSLCTLMFFVTLKASPSVRDDHRKGTSNICFPRQNRVGREYQM